MKAICAFSIGALALGLAACGSSTSSTPGGSAASTSSASGGGGGSSADGGAGGESSSTAGTGAAGGGGAAPIAYGTCWDPAPAGAAHAAPVPEYTGGACPALTAGPNDLTTGGVARQFLLVVPKDLGAGEVLPVIFLWHWLGGSASDFLERGDVQAAVDTQRFIAVLPEKKGDLQFTWPVSIIDQEARVEEEYTFFDDMLACVSQQFTINADCVGSAGVSAGALFTDQLAGGRGDHLSSIISLSGGVGGVIRPFGNPEHRMPAIVLWGGDTDSCLNLLSFKTLSQTLEQDLTDRGHFFVECIHNCGHSQPPFEAPEGLSTFAGLWGFVFDHPYWLPAGKSPYLETGLPPAMPSWCGIGAGSATPRTGECTEPSGC